MSDHLLRIYETLAERPDARTLEVEMLSRAERHQLELEWNDTQKDPPEILLLHQLIEDQAERTSEAVALVSADHHLTYREMNGRANRLARRLRRLGVGPEELVGICLERSVELVVGLLGILKAGGA